MARLGDAIRRLRNKKGMNQADLGKAVFLSRSTISDYENGATSIDSDTIEKLDATLEADGLLIDLWTLATSGNYSPEYVASQEAKAVRIHAWDNRVFPGLLQTADYSRCVMRAARPFDADELIGRDVDLRMQRQGIWQRETPPTGWFVFDESVLYRPFGGREVMHAQIDKILAMAALPRMFIQVMRFRSTSHPGNEGPLRIVQYSGANPAVYTEGWYNGRTTDAPDEVTASMTYFDLICASAMSPDRSAEFMARIRDTRYAE
jgi:transcriptional regulator with XRE-family HTH domain